MQSQPIAKDKLTLPLDPGADPAATNGRRFEPFAMTLMILFDFPCRKIARRVQHINDQGRSIVGLKPRAWRHMREIIDPFNDERRSELLWRDVVQSDLGSYR